MAKKRRKPRRKIVSEEPLGGGLYVRQYAPRSLGEEIIFGGIGEIKFVHKRKKKK